MTHDWRDPNMPVCYYIWVDGVVVQAEMTKETAQLSSQVSMWTSSKPTWRNDPTYNMRSKKYGKSMDKKATRTR
jgi:hypothetical protein